ncbi:MAG: hypothetical protein DBY04_00970 [Clostridiales bacterium]|nr:MAG: hypothetical protein DBY04_00970 [Clostridiales bacterium]
MGYHTWNTYGLGICLDNDQISSVERIQKLLQYAPALNADVHRWFAQNGVKYPKIEDYAAFDEEYGLGIAMLIKQVLSEAEGIEFTACDDYEGRLYLLYEPSYPWERSNRERTISEKEIREILIKYLSVIIDESIEIDYISAENGG